MNIVTAFVVFDRSGNYYGRGGFVHADPKTATPFSAEDALQMIKAFPNTTTLRVRVSAIALQYEAENTRELSAFHEVHEAA